MDCVTILIGLCIRSEVNGKRRTLVFLNMKICLVIFVGFNRKRTCLSRFRKVKRCIGRSIGIGEHFLRCYLVIFSIIEFQCDAVGCIDRSLFRLVILLKVNQAHVDLLSGTVETAVCEKLDIILYEIIFIVFYIVFTRWIVGIISMPQAEFIVRSESLIANNRCIAMRLIDSFSVFIHIKRSP